MFLKFLSLLMRLMPPFTRFCAHAGTQHRDSECRRGGPCHKSEVQSGCGGAQCVKRGARGHAFRCARAHVYAPRGARYPRGQFGSLGCPERMFLIQNDKIYFYY